MPDASIVRLTRRNLITLAKNAIGSNLFRNFYVVQLPDHTPFDVTEDGDVSCAVFVSTLLVMVGLLKRPHFVVPSVVKDMQESGWSLITAPKPGAVLVWSNRGDGYPHIGIVIDDVTCVYNSSSAHAPQKASFELGGRQPDQIFWHLLLEDPVIP